MSMDKQTDDRVISILIAHLRIFRSGELKTSSDNKRLNNFLEIITHHPKICTMDYPELRYLYQGRRIH